MPQHIANTIDEFGRKEEQYIMPCDFVPQGRVMDIGANHQLVLDKIVIDGILELNGTLILI